jgi:hypothetical protein
MKKSIYIQIPAYRDSELPSTIHDLCEKADHPKRIRIAVVWQHAKNEILPSALGKRENVEVMSVEARKSKGPNWARLMLQNQYQGEDYSLLLDSHHRFVSGWDTKLIEMYLALKRRGVKKPIITAYLPSYDPNKDPSGRMREVLKIYPLKRDNGLLTRLTGHPLVFWKWLKEPIPGDFISLHCLFAEGAINQEIKFDPDIYFFGDEVLYSLRAFSFGYDIFHPHIILGWHLYDRRTRIPHWDDHSGWREQDRASLNKLRTIYKGKYKERDYLGSLRSVKDYEDSIGTRLIED